MKVTLELIPAFLLATPKDHGCADEKMKQKHGSGQFSRRNPLIGIDSIGIVEARITH